MLVCPLHDSGGMGVWRTLKLACSDLWVLTRRNRQMADRLNVTLTFKAEDARDNSAFVAGEVKWSGVPYADFVMMEKSINAMMSSWGDAALAERKGKR